MDIDTKTNYEEEHGGEKGNNDRDDSIASPENLGLVCVSRHVEASIGRISGTTDKTPPHPPAREINANGAAFQSL